MVLDQPLETLVHAPVVIDLLNRKGEVLDLGLRSALAQEHEPVAVPIGERLQQHPVDQAENSGIGPNPQRQRDDGGDGEPRAFQQATGGVADIGNESVHVPAP